MTPTTQDRLCYRKVLDGLLRMHELFVAGERKSTELTQLRDNIDEPYLEMTEEERDAIEGLSTDLFDVERITSEPHLDSRPPANEKIQSALSAQHAGHYDEALRILRENKSSEPPSRISYFRGRNWEEKGEPRVALLFFNHAARLDPENEDYRAAALGAVYDAFPREREKELGPPDTVGTGGAAALNQTGTPTKPTFDVFLSHNSQDKSIVRQLADALVARGLRPWLDERELVPGRLWQEALEEIIQSTKSAVVIFGPAGLGPWEETEMRTCLNEFVKRKMPVFPVLLPGAAEEPGLPSFLKAFTWVDLRGGFNDDALGRLARRITGRKPP